MGTHNVHVIIKYENFPKISINICFLGLSTGCPRDSKMNSN